MKKKITLWIITGIMLFSACGVNRLAAVDKYTAKTVTLSYDESDGIPVGSPAIVGDLFPITRALAAKQIALLLRDKTTVDNLPRTIRFDDCSPEMWFDRYVNAACADGFWEDSGKSFYPDGVVTLKTAQAMLDKMDKQNTIKLQLTPETENKPISYALFSDLIRQLANNLGNSGVTEQKLIILAAPENNSKLAGANFITDIGPMANSGMSMGEFIDTEISVLKKGTEVLAVLGVVTDSPTIKNAFIVSSDNSSITIFSGGAERSFSTSSAIKPPNSAKICDIRIHNGTAAGVSFYSETKKAELLAITASSVELSGVGVLPVSPDAKIYSYTNNVVKLKSMSSLISGTDITELIMKNGEVCAAVITKEFSPESIRVLIGTTNFTGFEHDAVKLTATCDYVVEYEKDGKTSASQKRANEDISFAGGSLGGATRVTVRLPENTDNKITLKSITRNGGSIPKYRGTIEISLRNGKYLIVNEVSMDEYLYAVVPSEMPTSYGVEAAKVQAITARSYAYIQYFTNRFASYGANVDDSVTCQVYNNVPENSTSIRAVNETSGQYLTYNGEVISANFFSTSCGMTANSGEVWAGSSKQFPVSTSPFLKATKQYVKGSYGDLSVEKNAAAFFKNNAVEAYDSGSAWFRWTLEMTAQELAASINSGLKARYEANPQLIKTLQPNGSFASKSLTGIGDLINLEVMRRGEGGNIMELKITGSQSTVLVLTEYNIRLLLKPVKILTNGRDINIIRKNNSKVTNYSLLPSAFFTFEKITAADGSISFKFFGGGNGHGVGMSQDGVKGMIDKGYGYNEILYHYYAGTKVMKIEF